MRLTYIQNRRIIFFLAVVLMLFSSRSVLSESYFDNLYVWHDSITYMELDENTVALDSLFYGGNLPDSGDLEFPAQMGGKDVVRILDHAFQKDEGMIRVTIPYSVQVIEDGAFNAAPHLNVVIMEEGVQSIGKAFCQCPQLAQVRLPSTISEIAEGAFTDNGPFFHLVVYRGSYAEKYARENSIPYVCAEDEGNSLNLETGNVVEFGERNGNPVEWYVLAVDGSKALLLSKDVLESRRFSSVNTPLWYDSETRSYLNDTLIYELFDANEGGLISTRKIHDPASPYSFSGLPGLSSYDRLFLLSYQEAEQLLPSDNLRSVSEDWWLRTSYDDMDYNHYVGADGNMHAWAEDTEIRSIRPAMWIRTNSAEGIVKLVDDNVWSFDVGDEDDGVFGVGDTVQLGSYEQDNDETNGAETLDWQVLEVDGTTATLITKYGIDVQDYHFSGSSVHWGDTSLRAWLNDTFLNAAFSAEEQDMLIRTKVENFDTDAAANSLMYSWMIDPVVSEDLVWLLDIDEANRYFPDEQDKLVYPTKYVTARGVTTNNMGYAQWLLRTDKNYENRVEVIFPYRGGLSVVLPGTGSAVRPVIRVDLVKAGIIDETEAEQRIEAERKEHEDNLLVTLTRAAETDSVYMFDTNDYDGNGTYEGFGFIGYDDDQGILHGDFWFVSETEARQLLKDAHIRYLEMWGASAPYYWAVTEVNAEEVSHFWGVQDGTVVELDWRDYDPEKTAIKSPGEITNLQDGDVFTTNQDIEVKWNVVDGAGIYYVTAFYIDDAGEDYFWGDDVWGDRIYEPYAIPAGTLPADEYRIQVSAWIGTGGHGDEELACDSVYVTVIEGEKEASEIDSDMGFITPEDGITIQAGQKLELEWTSIPGAQVYSIDVYPPSGISGWWEAFYEGELSAVIPRSTLIESGYQIELSAWKNDQLVGGNEIFKQTITVYVHNKFEDTAAEMEQTSVDTDELHTSGDFVYRIQEDGTAAFAGFNGRGDLRVPETIDGYTVTAIADGACYWNSALESVHIPATVKTIGDGAFAWCGFLKDVSIRPGVTSIGDQAFMNTGIAGITLPDTITHIGASVLSNCDHLLYAELPDQLISMGDGVLSECDMLMRIAIPQGVQSIPSNAFFLCPNLASVSLPDGLREIGEMAFYACTSLQEIDIPTSVESIGEWAFASCTALSSRNIPDGVNLAEGAFLGCP